MIKNFKPTILLAILVLISGCSFESSNNSTLKTVSMFGEGDASHKAYVDLISDFTQSSNIIVEDESTISTEEWKSKTVDGILSGENIPDVIFYFTGADSQELLMNNSFVSIEEIREVYPDYGANIRSSSMEFMKEFDNKHYAIPVRGFFEGLFCNTDVFERYNLAVPTNWEQLLTAIEVLTENGVIPISASLSDVPHYWIEHIILAQGGSLEHQLNPYTYVPNSWVLALESFNELYNVGAFSENIFNTTNADAITQFANKESAMLLEGSWTLSQIVEHETTIVVPMPSTQNGSKEYTDIISGFSSGFYISKEAWHDPDKRDKAVQFVMHMTSNESISALCETGGAPSVDIEMPSNSTKLQESVKQLQENAKTTVMPIDSSLNKDAWEYFVATIPDLLTEKVTPTQVITKISEINTWS